MIKQSNLPHEKNKFDSLTIIHGQRICPGEPTGEQATGCFNRCFQPDGAQYQGEIPLFAASCGSETCPQVGSTKLRLKFGGENIDTIYKDICIHTEIYEHTRKIYANEMSIIRYLTVHIMEPQSQGL